MGGSGSAAPAPAPAGRVTKAFVPSKLIKNRYQAIVELAVAWRERQGWAPGVSEPSVEPCAARELLGECTVDGCEFGLSEVTAPMCAFGSRFRKYFTLLASRALMPQVNKCLDGVVCRGVGVHARHDSVRGCDEDGGMRSERAAELPAGATPPGLSRGWLRRARPGGAVRARPVEGGGERRDELSMVRREMSSRDGGEEVGRRSMGPGRGLQRGPGEVCDADSISRSVAWRIREVSREPTGFASYRNLLPPSEEELMRSPLPSVTAMARELAGRTALQDYAPSDRIQWDGVSDWREWVEGAPQVARQLGWDSVDPDIVEQAGGGGCEVRSEAPLHTTASWHHPGVEHHHFENADAVMRAKRQEQWTRVSVSPLPFVPCVFSPRDVILQEKPRLKEDGSLELAMKPRVTHDLSSVPRQLGGRRRGTSPNSGVPAEGKALPGMPSVQSYGRAQAVCALASKESEHKMGVMGIDTEKAYCYLVIQRADHYMLCFLWVDVEGRVRPHVSMRMGFTDRLRMDSASAQQRFDEEHRYPIDIQEWCRQRRQLQEAVVLPPGVEQCRPSGIEPFIDDLNGRAPMDRVSVPAYLAHLSAGEAQTAAIGAKPAPRDSRLADHCYIATYEVTWLGWSVAMSKTMCGDGMIVLGSLLDTRTGRVACPEVKRKWLRHAVGVFRIGSWRLRRRWSLHSWSDLPAGW
ncbi:MAG: hypothetical protein SGPRY_004465 [Prymnesium sp.]